MDIGGDAPEDSSHAEVNEAIYPTTELNEAPRKPNAFDGVNIGEAVRERLNGYPSSGVGLSVPRPSHLTSSAVSSSLPSPHNGPLFITIDDEVDDDDEEDEEDSDSDSSSLRDFPYMGPRSRQALFFKEDRSDPLFKTDKPTFSVNIPPATFHPLPYGTLRSGVVYDTRMRYHVSLQPDDDGRPHDEDPRRIAEIFNELKDAGLLADDGTEANEHQLIRIGIRQATFAELCLVHSERHVTEMEQTAGMPTEDLIRLGSPTVFDSLYFHPLSWLSATFSAGGAIEATKAVVKGLVKNSFAIIRPPGHHAEPDRPGGFCFFNNVPIAVKAAQADFPDAVRKVVILDWDVHHGNGIQTAFYNDPNVLYISLHVHENGAFYPKGQYKNHLHCGEGPGLGRNVNIPWSRVGMGDADYMFAFQNVVMPICIEFDPDLVVISAGFDAAINDPLGACRVTPAGFAHMTYMLKQLAKGKVVACLEGGYHLRSIAKSALAMTRVLMGEPPDRLVELEPSESAVKVVQEVVRTQSQFWRCLYPKDAKSERNKAVGAVRLHDIVRDWQAQTLFEEHEMTALPILRQAISKSFKNQVLATQNFIEQRPMLFVLHDPPAAHGFPDTENNKLELHNTFLTDVCKNYVDWAINNEFSVIDVNIPRHLTTTPDDGETSEHEKFAAITDRTREIAKYIWQNYIEISGASHLFILGIGDAYSGILKWLSENDSPFEDITMIIAFIEEHNLSSLRNSEDARIIEFMKRSMIHVAQDHDVWKLPKVKKRFGNVIRSPEKSLQNMLHCHLEEVTSKLLAETDSWRQARASARPRVRRKREYESDNDDEEDGAMDIDELEQESGETGMPPLEAFRAGAAGKNPSAASR